jgi:hypothetical protein
MFEILKRTARQALAALLGLIAVGPAHRETLVSSDFNARLILAFKVAEQPLKDLLLAGWQLSPIAAGPTRRPTSFVACLSGSTGSRTCP